MVEEFHFYYHHSQKVSSPSLCVFAYENKLHQYPQKQSLKRVEGVTWRPRDFNISHSPQASLPASIYIQRFIVKLNFWLLFLFLRKCHMLTATLQCFFTERSCSALWEWETVFPWHGGKKEVGRCDTPGGSSQQNKTWLDGKLEQLQGKEAKAVSLWAWPAI